MANQVSPTCWGRLAVVVCACALLLETPLTLAAPGGLQLNQQDEAEVTVYDPTSYYPMAIENSHVSRLAEFYHLRKEGTKKQEQAREEGFIVCEEDGCRVPTKLLRQLVAKARSCTLFRKRSRDTDKHRRPYPSVLQPKRREPKNVPEIFNPTGW